MESISEAIDESSRHGIRNGWTSRVSPKRRPTYVLAVLRRNLRKYCKHSSLVGYKYLVEPNRSWIEKVIWMILHVSTFCMLGMLVKCAYAEYENVPVTVIDSNNYPTDKLEFPGVAICNINRISRKAAIELANEIVSANITDWKFVDVLLMIKQLGHLYEEADDLNVTTAKYFDEMLRKYYKDDYDVTRIMKHLSPNCEDALSSCRFHNRAKNCSDIFVLRKTEHGFCCTFNYAREFDDISNTDGIKNEEPRRPYNISSLGLMNGLTLRMEPFVEDYYYPILPIIGWKVMIFGAGGYPDGGSGSVSEALLSPATETFVELDVTSFYSTNEIRNVAIEKRNCIFRDEIPILYTDYTYSDCVVECRASAIWDTCKCRPFYLPRRGDQYKQKICNTGDSECLSKYRGMYWTVLSQIIDGPVENERPYKLSPETIEWCKSCYPACDDIRYYLHTSAAYLDTGIDHTELGNNVPHDKQSIVHFYFTKHRSVRLRQELAYYWYELLSNIGGFCGIFVGFSLMSVMEFVYFMFGILLDFWRGNTRITTRRPTIRTISIRTRGKRGLNEQPFTGTLYWNEFVSPSRITKHDWRIQAWRH